MLRALLALQQTSIQPLRTDSDAPYQPRPCPPLPRPSSRPSPSSMSGPPVSSSMGVCYGLTPHQFFGVGVPTVKKVRGA